MSALPPETIPEMEKVKAAIEEAIAARSSPIIMASGPIIFCETLMHF
jgi:hypothetical protein